MTRIFGYESKRFNTDHISRASNTVLDNLQKSLAKTYNTGWHAYGLGFICIDENGAKGLSIFKGYKGISPDDNIREILAPELHNALANNPHSVFAVLQNAPDNGPSGFDLDPSWSFPIRSKNWLVMTMGNWSTGGGFCDINSTWYDTQRPARSINNYLEQSNTTNEINFQWIDTKRTPYIIAVKTDGSKIHVHDLYSHNNVKGYGFIKEETEQVVIHHGVRDKEGSHV